MINIDRMEQDVKLLDDIDLNLIDSNDETLVAIIRATTICWEAGITSLVSITGSVGHAYAAGRARGRRESAMREILEMEIRNGASDE